MLIELDIDNRNRRKKVYPCIITFVSDMIIVTFMPTISKLEQITPYMLTATMEQDYFFNVSKRSPDNKNSLAPFYLPR